MNGRRNPCVSPEEARVSLSVGVVMYAGKGPQGAPPGLSHENAVPPEWGPVVSLIPCPDA